MQQVVLTRAGRRGRRRAATAGLAALLLAVAPAAAQAEGWVPGPRFGNRFPTFGAAAAATPDGAAYAAWSEAGRDGFVTNFQRAGVDGSLGPIRTLPGGTSTVRPAVAAGDGGAAAVWGSNADAETELRLTLLAADGTVRQTLVLDSSIATTGQQLPVVAAAADGGALAVWLDGTFGSYVVKARRVAADGTPAAEVDLGAGERNLAAAIAPDGTGWVTWADAGNDQRIARIDASGAVDGAPGPLPVSTELQGPDLAASAAGAVFTAVGDETVEGVRLPLDDALIGSTFASATAAQPLGTSTLLADDGTVTLAWSSPGDLTTTAYSATYSRFAPGAASAPALPIAPEATGFGTVMPRLAQADDGSVLAAWAEGDSLFSGPLMARRIGADGSLGAIRPVGLDVPLIAAMTVPAAQLVPLAATPGGSGLAVVVEPNAAGPSALATAVLDATPPRLSATIPASGLTGQQLAFAATATDDRSGVSLWWDFGDGSGARTADVSHAYGVPGTYTVTVTATDAAGNVATAVQPVAITTPQPPPLRAPPATTPPPVTPGPAVPPVPSTRRSAASLKLTRAVRRGARVAVTGTIAKRATGRVTLAYAQRNGRRTRTVRTHARIANGRFRVTIRLPRALARTFRLRPTVTAAYAGDAATDAARVTRTVAVRAAKKRR